MHRVLKSINKEPEAEIIESTKTKSPIKVEKPSTFSFGSKLGKVKSFFMRHSRKNTQDSDSLCTYGGRCVTAQLIAKVTGAKEVLKANTQNALNSK